MGDNCTRCRFSKLKVRLHFLNIKFCKVYTLLIVGKGLQLELIKFKRFGVGDWNELTSYSFLCGSFISTSTLIWLRLVICNASSVSAQLPTPETQYSSSTHVIYIQSLIDYSIITFYSLYKHIHTGNSTYTYIHASHRYYLSIFVHYYSFQYILCVISSGGIQWIPILLLLVRFCGGKFKILQPTSGILQNITVPLPSLELQNHRFEQVSWTCPDSLLTFEQLIILERVVHFKFCDQWNRKGS